MTITKASCQGPLINTMKWSKSFLQIILVAAAATILLAWLSATFNPADYRPLPRYINSAVTLLAIPFQLILAMIGIGDIHDIGVTSKTLGVLTVELCILVTLRRLRMRGRDTVA
jgi:O-antigen ligase